MIGWNATGNGRRTYSTLTKSDPTRVVTRFGQAPRVQITGCCAAKSVVATNERRELNRAYVPLTPWRFRPRPGGSNPHHNQSRSRHAERHQPSDFSLCRPPEPGYTRAR